MSFPTIAGTKIRPHEFKQYLISKAPTLAKVYLAITVCFLVLGLVYANALNNRHALEYRLTKYAGPYIHELNKLTNPHAWRADIPTDFSRFEQNAGEMPDYFTAVSLFKMTMKNLDSLLADYVKNNISFDGVHLTLREKKRQGYYILKIEAKGQDSKLRLLADKILNEAKIISKSDLLSNLFKTKLEIEETLEAQLAHRISIWQAGGASNLMPLETQILKQHTNYLKSRTIDNNAFVARTFKPFSVINITKKETSQIVNLFFGILVAIIFAQLAFGIYLVALYVRNYLPQTKIAPPTE